MAAVAAIHDQLASLGVAVAGVSTDSIYAHKVFTETSPSASRARYPLISDRTGRISWLYGVLNPQRGTAGRLTVLIDPEGRIAFYMIYPQEVGRGTAEILRVIQGLQLARETGQGIPANWMPGLPGIQRSFSVVGRV